jgi:hypothetical protein
MMHPLLPTDFLLMMMLPMLLFSTNAAFSNFQILKSRPCNVHLDIGVSPGDAVSFHMKSARFNTPFPAGLTAIVICKTPSGNYKSQPNRLFRATVQIPAPSFDKTTRFSTTNLISQPCLTPECSIHWRRLWHFPKHAKLLPSPAGIYSPFNPEPGRTLKPAKCRPQLVMGAGEGITFRVQV